MFIYTMVVIYSTSPTYSLVDSFSSTSLIFSPPCRLWVREQAGVVLDMLGSLVTDLEVLGQ